MTWQRFAFFVGVSVVSALIVREITGDRDR